MQCPVCNTAIHVTNPWITETIPCPECGTELDVIYQESYEPDGGYHELMIHHTFPHTFSMLRPDYVEPPAPETFVFGATPQEFGKYQVGDIINHQGQDCMITDMICNFSRHSFTECLLRLKRS